MPCVQHKYTVLAALTAAQKPMTASQIDGVAGIGVSEVRKAMRKLAAAELVHIYAWSRENAARTWAPVWACGKRRARPTAEGREARGREGAASKAEARGRARARADGAHRAPSHPRHPVQNHFCGRGQPVGAGHVTLHI